VKEVKTMTRDEARADILTRLPEYVEMIGTKARDGKYCCPVCESGNHKNGTSAFKYDKEGDHPRWECYAHRNDNAPNKAVGDIFDLIGEKEHITDSEEQFQRALQIFRITIDDKPSRQRPTPAKKPEQRKEAAKLTNFIDYFARCAANNAPALDYLAKRGIPAEVATRHGVGYDAELGFKQSEKGNIKAVIFPTGSSTFVARNMDENATIRYINLAGQHVTLWNTEALQTEDRPVFVVEGIIDAMSIEAVGGAAVALNGAANGGLLLEAVKENPPKALLIVALDNETEANKKQTIDGNAERLERELKALGIRCARGNPAGTYKDANEALCAGREKFAEAVAAAEAAAIRDADDEHQKAAADYDSRYSAGACIQEFFQGIRDSVNTPALPTGFTQFDECLGGGLYEGLFILGGTSGTGKTTLLMQIADYIAAAGHDVLVFALEMAKAQLMARSISRHTYLLAGEKNYRGQQRENMAKSNIGITNFSKWKDYSAAEQNIIFEAAKEYGKYAKHVYIREGIGNIGAAEIREQFEQHVKITGRTPVVMVDYLQILAPADVKATDKQNTDTAVLELKRLSRDYKTPVIAVSSLNRASYSAAATEAAYRESSSIEYTSDVLLALQFSKIGTPGFDSGEEKGKATRDMQLSIIKNRNGEAGKKIGFSYNPKFNYFGEVEASKR
jgi:replicative DNA helicase